MQQVPSLYPLFDETLEPLDSLTDEEWAQLITDPSTVATPFGLLSPGEDYESYCQRTNRVPIPFPTKAVLTPTLQAVSLPPNP